VTLHTYTTIYNFGDKTGHTNNGWTLWYDTSTYTEQQLHMMK